MFIWLKRLFDPPKVGYNGGLVSPKDDRDKIKFIETDKNKRITAGISSVPYEFTLANKIGKILNQGQTNSCTGHAATYFMNILISKTLSADSDYKLNPFFNYYYARKESGLLGSDSGAYIRSTLNALRKYGVWSCNMANPFQKPPADYKESESFKLKGYEKLIQLSDMLIEDMKYILSIEQLPFLCCVNIIPKNYNTWSGKMKMPDNGEWYESSGWHAMTVVGYKIEKDGVYFHTANSWGSANGDKGFAWIHEDYFKNPILVSEIWCPTKTYF